MVRLQIWFESPIMPEDRLDIVKETVEECQQAFFDWWAGYGKSEREAMDSIINTELDKDYR